jgi:hypothetical protein
MPRQEMFAALGASDTGLRPYYLREAGSHTVDILATNGTTALASGVSCDNLLYSIYAAGSRALSEMQRRATAYAAATGATAAVTVTRASDGPPVLVAAGLTLGDIGQFTDCVLKMSGYYDRALAVRRQLLADGRAN